LFLNWRDSANPLAGGAETFTEEIGKRLVQKGNEITLFTSSFSGCEPEASRFGIRVIREGGKYSVYARARSYVKRHLSQFDVVIDEINTVPFRIHRIAGKTPVVAVIHQLAREVWFLETRFPLNVLGYFVLEPLWLRGYRRTPTVTVSNSTKDDLLKLGFRRVHVVHNGIGITPLEKVPAKESNPVLVFVGRLVRSKHPEHAIRAFEQIRPDLPDAELWILGEGYLRPRLENIAGDGVKFFGRVHDEEKFDLLKRAHVLLAPSVREGWGISVIEANAMGTPAVGYAVPGLKDSIVQEETGLLVTPQNPEALADAAKLILCNDPSTENFSMNALQWSRKFSWDRSAEEFYELVESTFNGF
jgi:glycosyltransferase involved in cell wall biosynthesis